MNTVIGFLLALVNLALDRLNKLENLPERNKQIVSPSQKKATTALISMVFPNINGKRAELVTAKGTNAKDNNDHLRMLMQVD